MWTFIALFAPTHSVWAEPNPEIVLASEMRALATIESNQGQNLNHPLITQGIQKNSRAGGQFGLMPNTAKYIIKLSPTMRAKYGFLTDLSADQITELLNTNRQLDRDLAAWYWKYLRKRMDAPRAALSWNAGPGTGARASDVRVRTTPYVTNFLCALSGLK